MLKEYRVLATFLGALLTGMSVISILVKGLSIDLVQIPLAMYNLYAFIFHNIIDILTAPFNLKIPTLVKDLIVLYSATGAVVLRSFKIFDRSVIAAGSSYRTFLTMLIWSVDISDVRSISSPKGLVVSACISVFWPLSVYLQNRMYKERLLNYASAMRLVTGERSTNEHNSETTSDFVPERDGPREAATLIGTAAVHYFRMTLWRTAFFTLAFVNFFLLWNAIIDNLKRGSVL